MSEIAEWLKPYQTPFDETLPDVTYEGDYDPTLNYHKVKPELWNVLSNRHKGIINHCFGGHEKSDSYYLMGFENALTDEQWRILHMKIIINSVWYMDDLTILPNVPHTNVL